MLMRAALSVIWLKITHTRTIINSLKLVQCTYQTMTKATNNCSRKTKSVTELSISFHFSFLTVQLNYAYITERDWYATHPPMA